MTKHNQFNYGITASSAWDRRASCGISSPPFCSAILRIDHGLGMNIGTEELGYDDGTTTICGHFIEGREQIRRAGPTVKAPHSNDYYLVGENKHYHTRTWCGDNLTFGGRDEGDVEHSIQINHQAAWVFANAT